MSRVVVPGALQGRPLPNPWNVWVVRLSIGISAALTAALVMLSARP